MKGKIGKAFVKLGGKLIETDASFMRINEGSKPVNLMDKEPSEKLSISKEDFLKIFFEDHPRVAYTGKVSSLEADFMERAWRFEDVSDSDWIYYENFGLPYNYGVSENIMDSYSKCCDRRRELSSRLWDKLLGIYYREGGRPCYIKQTHKKQQQQMEKKQPDSVIITPPPGWEIDKEKSTLGNIKFKEVKKRSYEDIMAMMVLNGTLGAGIMDRIDKKLNAIRKLLNMAVAVNEKGCVPCYWMAADDDEIRIIKTVGGSFKTMDAIFTSREAAQQALEILGEDVIRMALCQDY